MSKNNSSDLIERIAIALEEQNKTLKKIHVALNGISGNLIQHTRTIKDGLENVEGGINSCVSAIKNVDSELENGITPSLQDIKNRIDNHDLTESLNDVNANLLDISSSIKDELGNVLIDINRTLDGRLSDISSK